MDAATIVKRIRATDGLSRADLARLADVSASTVGRIESGKLDPTWSTLQKMLEATGMVLAGKTVVSAGDATAVSSARAILEGKLDAASPRWRRSWARAGWTTAAMTPESVLGLAVLAGNAAKFSRRSRQPLYVELPDQRQWQDLPRALAAAGVDYAISGLVATTPDRATAPASSPIIYVTNPRRVVEQLGLVETAPLRGTMLVSPVAGEMEGVETEGGLRFVSRVQAMLDAFASGGRQPEKAEAVALTWPAREDVPA
ncbi:MAG: helix-turn-helix domain-containing protein [Microbacterium sp.]|uniref:helix-turn-helix domain-containing protein n=1 Tax=Microbacterium sp. TaxID=51671 RepID=UPI003BAE5BB1